MVSPWKSLNTKCEPDITAVPERFVPPRHQHEAHHAEAEHVRGCRGVVAALGLTSNDIRKLVGIFSTQPVASLNLAISGAMNPTVPQKETLAWPVLSRYFARPKSISLIWKFCEVYLVVLVSPLLTLYSSMSPPFIMIFWGFKSRWMMPLSWTKFRALMISLTNFIQTSSFRL